MVMTLSFRHGDFERHLRPREALVVYGETPEARRVSDEQGLDFLSFPREIRDVIYSFVCVKPNFIGSETKFTKPFYKDAIAWRNLPFAGSCRQIWNESLIVYLVQNGFEFFYIRPFLEFLEKIGIRGRQLLRNLIWHHHWKSRPFIVLRYLRSCTDLRTLKIFARVTMKDRKRFWWGVPLKDAKRFFLTDHTKIQFGTARGFGKGTQAPENPPDFGGKTASGDFETKSLASLSNNLKLVKWEVSRKYKRPDLPSIIENGMCHWKYKMIEERKQQKKAEMNGLGGKAQLPSNGRDTAQRTIADGAQENEDDEMMDDEDDYIIQNGDLMKDGVLIASGTVFNGEDGLGDGC